MRAVALLRGVNVGGVRFAMKDLAAALEQAGFTDVRTVLASGNVILTAQEDDPRAIAAAVHRVVEERFGFDVAVVAAGLPVVRAAVDEYPFPRTAGPARLRGARGRGRGARGPRRRGAGSSRARRSRCAPARASSTGTCRRGGPSTARSASASAAGSASGAVTTRNLNTLERILAVG